MSETESVMAGTMTRIERVTADWPLGVIDGDLDEVVALERGEALTRGRLRERVLYWCARIQARDSGRLWVLYNPDAFEFSAQLLALWFSGKTVCLPGDNLAATQARLAPRLAGALGEWQGGLTEDATAERVDAPVLSCPATDSCVVEVYTSGSTGEPQAIAKQLGQLTAELQAHALHWPYDADEVVLSTVSHQHIYGLLFRILRPLAERVPFERRLCHYLEDLQGAAECYPKCSLITSPSHLERLPETPEWRALAPRWHRAFSSAAPLGRETSLRAQAVLGCGIVEIYGSSETGGIAWRIQNERQDMPWQPLAGIELKSNEDRLLMLRSRHLPDQQWYTQPDRVEWVEGDSFRLLGRTDRIAKVEGKRVSLTAMEQALTALPEIAAAHALVLSGRREEVGVVLVPTEVGRQALSETGQGDLQRRLKATLSSEFEAVALPRRWRIVDTLPWNAQGKLTQRALSALFENSEARKPTLPEVLGCEMGEGEVRLALQIPEDLLYFDGHFDSVPILPGVVQVHWAQHLARSYLPVPFAEAGRFDGMERIKFQQLLRPGMRVDLLLQVDADKRRVDFSYSRDTQQFSSGRIRYAVD